MGWVRTPLFPTTGDVGGFRPHLSLLIHHLSELSTGNLLPEQTQCGDVKANPLMLVEVGPQGGEEIVEYFQSIPPQQVLRVHLLVRPEIGLILLLCKPSARLRACLPRRSAWSLVMASDIIPWV